MNVLVTGLLKMEEENRERKKRVEEDNIFDRFLIDSTMNISN